MYEVVNSHVTLTLIVSVLFRVLQRTRTNRIYTGIYKRNLLYKFVPMSMEAKKSHDLPSWRPRRARGMIQSQSQKPKNQRVNRVRPGPNLKA